MKKELVFRVIDFSTGEHVGGSYSTLGEAEQALATKEKDFPLGENKNPKEYYILPVYRLSRPAKVVEE